MKSPVASSFHIFQQGAAQMALPERFTYPFCYTPHPLCTMAAQSVQAYLHTQPQWQKELAQGKMFGVLVVQTAESSLGYLAAFSGNLAGKNDWSFFVPPVYNLLQPDGHFKQEEAEISALNKRIEALEETEEYVALRAKLRKAKALSTEEIAAGKLRMKHDKALRDKQREQPLSEADKAALVRQSQFQKAELRRLEKRWQMQITVLNAQCVPFAEEAEHLKEERKKRSAALQHYLFEQFKMLNAKGETRDLCTIFSDCGQKIPPAGAGECAAPKLLQYAYKHQLRPVCMAEFWWGDSPVGEVRHHGHYYPACKSKCAPILAFMLQGLPVDENPLDKNLCAEAALPILYEDDDLLAVNKPAGMLSVPGKTARKSVLDELRPMRPDADLRIVHRLDMDTSGILLIAKTLAAYQQLQAQFSAHTVKKRYVALLEGTVEAEEGDISLPLCADIFDRPRQMVSKTHGKVALTHFHVLERRNGHTLIAFEPHTGRTHQLRVHASHPQGLNAPIVGDALYGQAGKRLHLHAERIEFQQPTTGKNISIEVKEKF